MPEIELLIACLGVVAGGVLLAGRLGVPYPIFLLAAGIGIAFIPSLPDIELDPDVIFLVFLPPLIHAAAWQTSPRHLRRHARTITLLALGNVAVGTAAIALVAHALIPDLTWGAAFVLGAVLSPTDTVAATAVFRRVGVPERVVGIVEGESLINDGAALVVYRIAVAAVVTGAFSTTDAVRELLLVGSGGVIAGLVIAYAVRHMRRRVDDSTIEIVLTLLTPYAAWVVAEEIGASGILAAVSSGLYLGWRSAEDFSANTRLEAYSFWGVFTFILEAVLFILIGLQIPGVLDSLSDEPAGNLVLWAGVISATVIAVRVLFQLSVAEADRAYAKRKHGARKALTFGESAIVGWSGMRGAVSLAAALAVPLQTDAGGAFPARDLILFITLAVIAVTLLLQGLTLPLLARRLVPPDMGSNERRKAQARFQTTEAALAHVGELSFDTQVPASAVERARSMYSERARQLSGACSAGVAEENSDTAAWLELRRRLLDVERAELLRLRNEGRVGMGVMREVQRDLDLEEERVNRVTAPNGSNRTPVGAAS